MSQDTIPVILPVPPEVKGQWVRASREQGQKLSTWLLQRIALGDKAMQVQPVTSIRAWHERHGHTFDSGAQALDVGRRTYARYITADTAPTAVLMACQLLDMRQD